MLYDLIIIGGGPAGITAGIYAARQKINTLLVTKSFGGQISRKAMAIENYPGLEGVSADELIQRFENQLKKQKVDIEIDEVIELKKKGNIFLVKTKNKKSFESKTVIIASGADPQSLEAVGEKEYIGRGVSYCVQCDGPLFAEKRVAVIGGGNAGFEAAIFISRWAKKVYILEFEPEAKADKEDQELVQKTGKIEIITSAFLKEIKGNQFVHSIIYQDRKSGENMTLPIDGVFIEVGSQPSTSFVKDLVDLNEKKEIKVEFETYQTKTPGLFVAGDVNGGKYKQIITACGEGAKTSMAAYDYLKTL